MHPTVNTESETTSSKLHCCCGALLHVLRRFCSVYAEERESAPSSKFLKPTTSKRETIQLVKCIGEEGDAQTISHRSLLGFG